MNTHDPNFVYALNKSRLDDRLARARLEHEGLAEPPPGLMLALRGLVSNWLVRLGGWVSPFTGEPAREPELAHPGT